MGPTRIAVTGAAGLVGRAVVACLLDAGHEVVPLVRPGGRTLPGAVEVDIGDPSRLRQAFDRCVAVVHAAGRMSGDAEQIAATNVAGARNVVDACRSAGVTRLVLLSSVAVYGEGDMERVDESRPIAPTDAYGRSKAEAEQIVRAAAGAVDSFVLRPTTVWSPSDRDGFTSFVLTLARDAVIPLCRSGAVRFDLIGAGDLAQACALAATVPAPGNGQILHVTSDEGLTVASIVERLRRLGLPGRTLDVDDPLRPPDGVDPGLVAAVAEHRHFLIDRAREVLGYSPKQAFPTGLDRHPVLTAGDAGEP